MKPHLLRATLLTCGLLSPLLNAQPIQPPPAFPLAGDWNGALTFQGTTYHLVLHVNTTPEGKMTVLLDNIDENILGNPAVGGSFDGSRLTLRFFYWKPDSTGDLRQKFATYEATINAATSEMTGVWTQEGAFPINFKRITWQAKIPKPAPPTDLDGDWLGTEDEENGAIIHFIFHIHNTEDGLMVLIDCPEEKFKGALASKAIYNHASRELSITIGQAIFAGKMSINGKALDTQMTEPGYHFWIHFDRQTPKQTAGN
jgi:hypothetical protein